MDAEIGRLISRITADNSGLKRALDDSDRDLKKYSSGASHSCQRLGDTFLNLKRIIIGLAGAAGVGMLTKSFVNAAAESENYRVRLEVLLRSQSEGVRLFKEMADYASRVPHTYQEIMASATQLSGVMKGGVDQIKQWMPLIGDLAAAAGLDLQTTTQQVVRMFSAGAGAADLFRERGILAMMDFKAGVHYSAEETRRMMLHSWERMDSQWKGAADKLGGTWRGLLSMMSDRWFQFRNKVMDAGIFESLKEGVDNLIEAIDKLDKEGTLDKWAKDTGVIVVSVFKGMVIGVNELAKSVERVRVGFAAILEMALPTMIKNITKQVEGLQKQIDKPTLFLGGSQETLEFNKKWLEKLTAQRKEYETMLDAARRMGLDSIKNIDQIDAAFQEVIDTIQGLKRGINSTTDDTEKLGDEGQKAAEKIREALTGEGKLSQFSTNFGLTGFSPLLDFDPVEVEKKVEDFLSKLLHKQENQWDIFSEYAGNSLINALVDGSDDWIDYLSREFKRTFLQETIGTQMKSFMSGIFGEKGFFQSTTFKALNGASLGDLVGAGAVGYGLGGVGGGIGSLGGFAAGSAFLTEGVFGTGGKLAGLGGPIGMAAGGLFGGLLGSLFEEEIDWRKAMRDQLNAEWEQSQIEMSRGISDTLKTAISEGFKAGYESEGYQSFLDAFKTDLGNDITESFSQIMATKAVEPLMELFEPAFAKIGQYINPETLIAQSWAGLKEVPKGSGMTAGPSKLGGLVGNAWPGYNQSTLWNTFGSDIFTYENIAHTGAQWLELFNQSKMGIGDIASAFPSSEEFQTALDEMKPTFETVTEYLNMVKEALGINTDAITQNTDAIIVPPVEGFLRELTVGSLATGLSMEGIKAEYDKLLNEAILDPNKFSTFSSYAGQTYLDTMAMMGGYNQAVEGVKSDVLSLPWYQNQGSSTPQAIGAAVAQAVAPLVAATENKEIHLHLTLSGKEVAAEVVNQIENSAELTNQIRRIHY